MPPPDDGRLFKARASSGAPELIKRYEAIAGLSRAMLRAAHEHDWDEVARLEARCRELIAQLKAASKTVRLSAAEQRRRIEILRTILAVDAEIRERAEPWLKQLERLIVVPAPRGSRRLRD
jgi:flagellar protein FliT